MTGHSFRQSLQVGSRSWCPPLASPWSSRGSRSQRRLSPASSPLGSGCAIGAVGRVVKMPSVAHRAPWAALVASVCHGMECRARSLRQSVADAASKYVELAMGLSPFVSLEFLLACSQRRLSPVLRPSSHYLPVPCRCGRCLRSCCLPWWRLSSA